VGAGGLIEARSRVTPQGGCCRALYVSKAVYTLVLVCFEMSIRESLDCIQGLVYGTRWVDGRILVSAGQVYGVHGTCAALLCTDVGRCGGQRNVPFGR
jgi:hypothetical protein